VIEGANELLVAIQILHIFYKVLLRYINVKREDIHKHFGEPPDTANDVALVCQGL
jgi:hypothetical protein